MNVGFAAKGWMDYRHWIDTDPAIVARIGGMIEEIRRNPFGGLGKPEALRGDLVGWWSRRITREHRLVYRVDGKPGLDQRVTIGSCRYHYGRP